MTLGWASEDAANSFSWFDASVRRPYGRNNLRRIHLIDNRLTNPEFCKQSIKLVPNHPWGVNWKPWLKALKPGDVIELVPWAMYPARLNIIRSAKIELEYDGEDARNSFGGEGTMQFELNAPLYKRCLDAETLEIRVLSIHPGDFNDPITCHIGYVRLHKQLGDDQDFDALSYSWGDSQDHAEIAVAQARARPDDRMENASITRPAESAIRHLRHRNRILRLWIDVICINQNDTAERAQQVGMMAMIFSRAQTVHVWLGLHPGIEAALHIIRDIFNFNKRICPGGAECSCQGVRHTAISAIQAVADQHKDWERHIALRTVFELHYRKFTHAPREYAGGTISPHISTLMSHLFENAWFRRVWVLQEVLRARQALVHCGAKTITWEELTTVNGWLEDRDFTSAEPHLQPSKVTMPPIWSDLAQESANNVSSASSVNPLQPTILSVYLDSLDLKSKEPRDKIFAVLSFGHETHIPQNLPIDLRPDYEKPLSLVFADFTRWWITHNQSLSILSYIHAHRSRTWQRMLCSNHQHPPAAKPTWAIPMSGTRRWSQATLEAQFPHFRASGDTKPDIGLLNNLNLSDSDRLSLLLRGDIVATIKSISHLVLPPSFHPKTQPHYELYAAIDKIFDAGGVLEHWKLRSVGNPRASKEKMQRECWDHLVSHRRDDGVRDVAINAPFSDSQGGEITPVGSCTDPFFFSTQNGMLGLCPWRARVGDLIVLLLGGNVPFLLRRMAPVGGQQASGGTETQQGNEMESGAVSDEASVAGVEYDLVGECFVMGAMNGELMKEIKEKRREAEVLRVV